MRSLLCVLGLLGALAWSVPASAVTANLCVRNDGVGTFSGSDLSIFATCNPASGNVTDSGPGTSLAPGGSTCISLTGLQAWNGFQYTYVFELDFMDSNGVVTVSSPAGLQMGNGQNYITANGVSTSSGSSSDYISLVNQAPPAYTSLGAYPNFGAEETECYVYWSGVTSGQVQDWGHNELQRASSASGPWTTVYPQYAWGSQNRVDTGLTPGTTYHYRIDTVDEYGAVTEGATATCTTQSSGPPDNDGDGWDSTQDCDDANAAVNPGAPEVCADGIDNDCDALVDVLDPDCASGDDDDSTGDDDDSTGDDDDSTGDDDDSQGDDDDSQGDDDDSQGDDDDSQGDDDDSGDAGDDDDSAGDDDDATPNFEGDEPGECSDGADNDQDGDFDCEDDDCAGAEDCESENGAGCGQGRTRRAALDHHATVRLAMLLAVLGGFGIRRRLAP